MWSKETFRKTRIARRCPSDSDNDKSRELGRTYGIACSNAVADSYERRRALAHARQDFICGSISARHCSMYRAVVAGYISGFAGEKQGIFDWASQGLLRAIGADCAIAVGASGKRIALPVMEVGR